MQYVSFDSAYYTEFTFAGLFAGLLILWTVFAYHRPVRLTILLLDPGAFSPV